MPSVEEDARSWLREVNPGPPVPAGQLTSATEFTSAAGSARAAAAHGNGHRVRRRGTVRAALVTMRPRQWIKNFLVVAAPGAAGALAHDDVPVRVAVAFVAFCLLASGIYAFNDVRDAAEDRRHPRKRHRPVAAGELQPRTAIVLGAALMIAGLVACALVRPMLAVVGAAYLALTLSYTTVWRGVVIADIFAIAGGFVLRAIAGGVAAPVDLSHWFVLVVVFSAVFVAAGKRHAELRRAAAGGRAGGRAVLRQYTEGRLRLALTVSMVLALISYFLWAAEGHFPWRMITIAPFAGCLLRYNLLLRQGDGEAPEDLVFGDRWLMLCGFIWILTFVIAVRATH